MGFFDFGGAWPSLEVRDGGSYCCRRSYGPGRVYCGVAGFPSNWRVAWTKSAIGRGSPHAANTGILCIHGGRGVSRAQRGPVELAGAGLRGPISHERGCRLALWDWHARALRWAMARLPRRGPRGLVGLAGAQFRDPYGVGTWDRGLGGVQQLGPIFSGLSWASTTAKPRVSPDWRVRGRPSSSSSSEAGFLF